MKDKEGATLLAVTVHIKHKQQRQRGRLEGAHVRAVFTLRKPRATVTKGK
jgi:hypothetical protein